MSFAKIAQSLGIEEYPQRMDRIYQEVMEGAQPVFDRALIDRHHQERELYGEFYPQVVAGYEDLLTKQEAYIYAQVAARFMLGATHAEAKTIPLPEPDGSPARDMLPLFIELPMVDRGIAEFVKRGVSLEQAEAYMKVFRSDIQVNIRRHGRPGLDKLYFNWITLYLYALIFPCNGFKVNVATSGTHYYVLRNRATGQVEVLAHNWDVHRSGEILGAAGLTDPEGSFHVEFRETDTHWVGHPTNDRGRICREEKRFPKAQWELAVKPGDNMLSIHLPGGMALSRQITLDAARQAFAHCRRYYADYDPKAIHCSSWLLNPDLDEVLGPQSNILAFGSCFRLHPNKCAGNSVFNFVFKVGVNPDIATLPEDTRLQRHLKAKYLAGEYHRNFGGYLLPEML